MTVFFIDTYIKCNGVLIHLFLHVLRIGSFTDKFVICAHFLLKVKINTNNRCLIWDSLFSDLLVHTKFAGFRLLVFIFTFSKKWAHITNLSVKLPILSTCKSSQEQINIYKENLRLSNTNPTKNRSEQHVCAFPILIVDGPPIELSTRMYASIITMYQHILEILIY
jgi:hypothetical protein